MKRAVAAVALALSLAGCGSSVMDSFNFMKSDEKPIERNLPPTNFKAAILRTVPSIVADPSGIREAYYSDPVIDPQSAISVYTSCVRFNARDSSKQYTGSKEYILYYYGGQLQQFVLAKEGECRYATYKPFPELEKLCPSGKCS
jgi:hypothetical protein